MNGTGHFSSDGHSYFCFSAIKGFKHTKLRPLSVRAPSEVVREVTESDIIFTAETHNMPTAVAPFSGATTGTGGRIRDVQGVGRGGHTVAGTAGYSVGNLNIPGMSVHRGPQAYGDLVRTSRSNSTLENSSF